MSNFEKEDWFPFICTGCAIIGMLCTWVFQIQLRLGVLSLTLGLTVNFGLQILVQVLIIWKCMPVNIFSPLPLRKIFANSGEVLDFLWEYSVAFYAEYLNFELSIFILLWSKDPVLNIMIWSSMAQIINMVYYMGYSVGSFVRIKGTRLLALEKRALVKELIIQTIYYMLCLCLVLTVLGVIYAPEIAKVFIDSESGVDTFIAVIRIFSVFFVGESFTIFMASTLRMLEYSRFTKWVTFSFFFVISPSVIVFRVFWCGGGVIDCVSVLAVCDFLLSATLLMRLLFGLEFSIDSAILGIQETNRKFIEKGQEKA